MAEIFEVYERQLDFFNPLQYRGGITVIGVGGIGSCAVLALTKMGLSEFDIYDFDYVEAHNRPNQMVMFKSTGTLKVQAVSEVMELFAPDGSDSLIINPHQEPFTKDTIVDNEIVIIAVDSRDARIDIWQALKKSPSVKHVIDARMGGEQLQVYNITMGDEKSMAKYEESFNGEPTELPCTGRAIIYNLFAVSAFIGSSIRKYVNGEEIHSRVIHDTRNWVTVLTK